MKRRVSGSFSIEAAVVVPLVMTVMATMIFATFFLHDKATVSAVTDYALLECFREGKTGSAVSEQAVTSLLSSRLYSAEQISVSVNAAGDHAAGSAKAQMKVPLRFLKELFGEGLQNISCNMDLSNMDGRGKLLLYQSICDGIADLSGGLTK